jgi:hypothetical protein
MKLIENNLRLASGSLNHIRAETFDGKPSGLEWARRRTNQRHRQVSAIEPNRNSDRVVQVGCGQSFAPAIPEARLQRRPSEGKL